MKNLEIYTDGSCFPNPGLGGWCFVILDKQGEIFYFEKGRVSKTTNNVMELMGIKKALEYLIRHQPESARIYSDSRYAINVTTGEYKAKKNLELVLSMRDLLVNARAATEVEFEWVRGHSGVLGNEIADELANRMAECR